MSDGSSFRFTVDWDTPESVMIVVAGEVDSPDVIQMQRNIAAAIDEGARKVVFDLSHVEFIGFAGLNALVVARNRLNESDGTFLLRDPNPMVRKLIALSGLESVLPVER